MSSAIAADITPPIACGERQWIPGQARDDRGERKRHGKVAALLLLECDHSDGTILAIGSLLWLLAVGLFHFAGASGPEEAEMTALWLYAYVVLPVIIVAMGYGAMRLVERRDGRRSHASDEPSFADLLLSVPVAVEVKRDQAPLREIEP